MFIYEENIATGKYAGSCKRHVVAYLVEALHYKPDGRGFEFS
jgi:hypothetical protein